MWRVLSRGLAAAVAALALGCFARPSLAGTCDATVPFLFAEGDRPTGPQLNANSNYFTEWLNTDPKSCLVQDFPLCNSTLEGHQFRTLNAFDVNSCTQSGGTSVHVCQCVSGVWQLPPAGSGGGGGTGDITAVGGCATGACFTNAPANQFVVAPSGASGPVALRNMLSADLPSTITKSINVDTGGILGFIGTGILDAVSTALACPISCVDTNEIVDRTIAIVDLSVAAIAGGSSATEAIGTRTVAADPRVAPLDCIDVGEEVSHTGSGITFKCRSVTANLWIPIGARTVFHAFKATVTTAGDCLRLVNTGATGSCTAANTTRGYLIGEHTVVAWGVSVMTAPTGGTACVVGLRLDTAAGSPTVVDSVIVGDAGLGAAGVYEGTVLSTDITEVQVSLANGTSCDTQDAGDVDIWVMAIPEYN